MTKALTIVKTNDQKPKRKREQIVSIETPPQADWFVCTRERGRRVWYLRFRVTGMLPRRFGPYASRHKAILALDAMIDTLEEMMWDLNDPATEFRLKRRFQQTWGPVIEDDLALPNGGRMMKTVIPSTKMMVSDV
jgi:hypothetical protein